MSTLQKIASEKRAAGELGKESAFFGSQRKRLNEIITSFKKGLNIEVDEVKAIGGAKAKTPAYNLFVQGVKDTVNQKKGDVNLRTIVNLPEGSGKKIKVAVVCEDGKLDEAKKTEADLVGSDDLIEKINSGKIDFDKLISTPTMMIKLSKLGKVLGPKGLMPNPKLGTVTTKISDAVKLIKSGQVEIKNDKDGNIGSSIGKKSFSDQSLIKNFNSIIDTILKEKPSNVKGQLIKSTFITSTMGISYKLKLDKTI